MPTNTQQESSQRPADDVTLIVGASVASLITIIIMILFAMILIVCGLKKRYLDFVNKRKTFLEFFPAGSCHYKVMKESATCKCAVLIKLHGS